MLFEKAGRSHLPFRRSGIPALSLFLLEVFLPGLKGNHIGNLLEMLLLFQACNLLFRQNQAKLSHFSATSIDESIKLLHSFIPSEFNRKMRPLSEVCYWKATELRLFMLYAGVVVLKSRHILSERKYLTFN